MTENEGGTIYKLWKDEDYPQGPTEQTVVETPVVEEPKIPAEPPVQTTEPTEQPPAKEPQLDIDKVIQERLGRPVDEVQRELSRIATLERLAVEDDELVPDDDFLKNFIKAYKRGGKTVAEGYIQAVSVDYSKLTPEQLVEHSVRKRIGSDAPKTVFEAELKRELASMGWSEDLEPGTPEEKTFRDYIQWKASQLREQFTVEQKNFKVPERQQQQAVPAVDPKEIENYVLQTKTNPDTLGLLERKAVKIGELSLPANPDNLIAQALDTGLFLSKFIKQNGEPDYNKFYQYSAIEENGGPEEFARKVAAEAVAKERLKFLSETKNPSEPDPKPTTVDPTFKVRFMQ